MWPERYFPVSDNTVSQELAKDTNAPPTITSSVSLRLSAGLQDSALRTVLDMLFQFSLRHFIAAAAGPCGFLFLPLWTSPKAFPSRLRIPGG